MGVNNRVSSVRQVSNRRHYTNEGREPADDHNRGGPSTGGAIGGNAGRDSGNRNDRDVEHRVQMTAPPGRTILVNRDGEPRQ
jgi:hypothetical protein